MSHCAEVVTPIIAAACWDVCHSFLVAAPICRQVNNICCRFESDKKGYTCQCHEKQKGDWHFANTSQFHAAQNVGIFLNVGTDCRMFLHRQVLWVICSQYYVSIVNITTQKKQQSDFIF